MLDMEVPVLSDLLEDVAEVFERTLHWVKLVMHLVDQESRERGYLVAVVPSLLL